MPFPPRTSPDTATVVRDATAADHERVRAISLGVYVGEGYASPAYGAIVGDIARRAAHTQLLVATDGRGRVIGAVSLVLDGGPYAELITDPAHEALFRMLAVNPDARGRGVGRALVGECLARATAAGRARMVISTEPVMHAAHALYESMGFARGADRDWSPEPGVDLLVYTRTLP